MTNNNSRAESKTLRAIRTLIKAHNKSHASKLAVDDALVIFHVSAILTRIEILKEDPLHSTKECATYQNELSKVAELLKSRNAITEVRLVTVKGKPVKITSQLLIHFIEQGFDLRHARKSRGGKPKDLIIGWCYPHIKSLQALGVPFEFIASLFHKDPDTLLRALSRSQTKPPSNSI
ncbi:MAG TPA: hypothetical protein VFE50_25275 [Cyclobacteriaceae bacterium]|nr:hypothetical protein [Cyclobacteriaceae bacterium]